MDKYLEMLGHTFKDRVTGFAGVADSVSFDLYGCVQVSLMPPAVVTEKGSDTPNGIWYDAARLEQTSSTRVMEVPTFECAAVRGPANKAPRS